jgi:hypothetical protein
MKRWDFRQAMTTEQSLRMIEQRQVRIVYRSMKPTLSKATRKHVAAIMTAWLFTACSSPPVEDVPYDVRTSCLLGETIEVTMGDDMCWVVGGRWMDAYMAQRTILLPGLDPIAAGTIWIQAYSEEATGMALLFNSDFDEHIALRLAKNGMLSTDPSAVQIGGMKRGRRWTEEPTSSERAMKWVHYHPHPEFNDQTGWRLYYVGVDNKRLRLTADNLGPSGEALGRIEYTHDLGASDTFVFRGMSIRVDEMLPDGRLRFTALTRGRL